jgi:transposase
VFTVEPIELSEDERAELKRRASAHPSTVREARRARVILLCADGMALRRIAGMVDMDQHQVGEWRRRFLTNRLEGLRDQPRSGRPRRLGHDQRLAMAAVATSERDSTDPVATWSYFDVATELGRRGVEVSVSQVWRILRAMDIDLSKVRGWLNRRDDPSFWDRVRDICGLYLGQPDQALVLSVDEKTSIQAKQRKHPDQTPAAGKWRRREFEYIRHGTASLFAALDVHTGEVLAEPIPGKNNSVNFCAFLDDIERAVDPAGHPRDPRQRLQPRVQAHQGMVRRPPPMGRPLHATPCQLGQPGRTVLLDPATQGHRQRQLHLTRRPHRQAPRLHHRLRPDRPTLQMDLRRRPPRRITNTRPTSARQH